MDNDSGNGRQHFKYTDRMHRTVSVHVNDLHYMAQDSHHHGERQQKGYPIGYTGQSFQGDWANEKPKQEKRGRKQVANAGGREKITYSTKREGGE